MKKPPQTIAELMPRFAEAVEDAIKKQGPGIVPHIDTAVVGVFLAFAGAEQEKAKLMTKQLQEFVDRHNAEVLKHGKGIH